MDPLNYEIKCIRILEFTLNLSDDNEALNFSIVYPFKWKYILKKISLHEDKNYYY